MQNPSLLERLRSGVTDIIETEDQKAVRQASERELAARPLRDRGLPVGLNLISEIAGGVPSTVEAVRQAGMSFGMPLQTDSEMMEQAFANFEDTPEGRARTINAVKAIDPIRAAGLVDIFQQRDREAELRTQADADRLLENRATEQGIQTSAAQEQNLLANSERNRAGIGFEERRTKVLEDEYGITKDLHDLATEDRRIEMDTTSGAITSAFDAIRQLPGGEIYADMRQSSFPLTYQGAQQAWNLYEELAKPTEVSRDIFIDTIVDMEKTLPNGETNPYFGMPLRIMFDKNDEAYSHVLGVDDSIAEHSAGGTFAGSLRAPAGQLMPTENFDTKLLADKIIGLAFDPNLESVVGPTDRFGRAILAQVPFGAVEQAELVDRISRQQTQGILPFIRALAPVTEEDVKILEALELGLRDKQDVWMRMTLQEKLPKALNMMHNALNDNNLAQAGAQRAAIEFASRAYAAIGDNPSTKIFDTGKYSTTNALRDAFALLPKASDINIDEFNENIYSWKGRAINDSMIRQIAGDKVDFNTTDREQLQQQVEKLMSDEGIQIIQR